MGPRALFSSLFCVTLLAACGGPPPPAHPEGTPAPSGSGTLAASASGASTAPASSGSAASTQPPKQPLPDRNTPLQASKMLTGVKQIGVDVHRPLGSLPNAKKKELMNFFVKALGYEDCQGCHVGDDYERETRNMKITRKMWENFVMPLRDAQGGALFCDSCHAGKAKPLDHANEDGLKKLMETDYQGKITRADKKEHDCSTCHGAGPEPKIIEKLWGIKAK